MRKSNPSGFNQPKWRSAKRQQEHVASSPQVSHQNHRITDSASIRFAKQDIETIVGNLQSCPVETIDDIKRVKSLLETLSSFFCTFKTSSAYGSGGEFGIDFTAQIVSLNRLVREISDQNSNATTLLLLESRCEIQCSTLKNIRNLLKINSDVKNNLYASLLDDWLDCLIAVRAALIERTNQRNLKSEISIPLDGVALSLLKCIFAIVTRYDFEIDAIRRTNLCAKYIGALRCFAFYGLKDYDLRQINVKLYPSPVSQFCAADSIGLDQSMKSKKKLPNKIELLNDEGEDDEDVDEEEDNYRQGNISFSATDFSSSELDENDERRARRRELRNDAQYGKKLYANIRMLAYESLQASFAIFGIRIVFGFWSSLFPDSPIFSSRFSPQTAAQTGAAHLSVLATIARDSSNRVRISALNFMYNFFNFGKYFIRTLVTDGAGSGFTHTKTASSSAPSSTASSFTPLSASLTAMVREIHQFFAETLLRESNTGILISLYKSMSAVVSATPYRKLRCAADLLHPLFHRNTFMLDHRATQIKNLSLALFVKIFAPEPLAGSFHRWLTALDEQNDVIARGDMRKILLHCFEFIRNPDCVLLAVESIKLLTSIVWHHELCRTLLTDAEVRPHLEMACQVAIDLAQGDRAFANAVLQSLICKYLHAWGTLLKYINASNRNTSSSDDDKQQEKTMQFIKQWFLQVIDSRLFKCALIERDHGGGDSLKNSSQVTLIHLISLIPESVFELIDRKTHYHIISILMALAKEDHRANLTSCPQKPEEAEEEDGGQNLSVYTKSAAIRCLAIMHSFACLADDASLTADLVDLCIDSLTRTGEIGRPKTKKQDQTKKKEIFLLENSLWALANVCDVIKKADLEADLDAAQLRRVIGCLSRCHDVSYIRYHTDDILVNLVRCSGIVLYILLLKQQQQQRLASNAAEISEIETGFEPPITVRDNENLLDIDPRVWLDIINRMLDYLTNKKLYKLQWNVCIALSYVMPFDAFMRACHEFPVTGHDPDGNEPNLLAKLFTALFGAFRDSANQKVQSYAIYAICSARSLSEYRFFCDRSSELLTCAVDKFITDFHRVPAHSRKSWFDKYAFALQRLAQHQQQQQTQQAQPAQQAQQSNEILNSKLRQFMQTELAVNKEEEDTNYVGRLQAILHLFDAINDNHQIAC